MDHIPYAQNVISVPSCEALQNLENGEITYSEFAVAINPHKYSVNTEVSFTCNPAYMLNGSNLSIWQSSLNWTQQTPRCEQGNKKKGFSANFKTLSKT